MNALKWIVVATLLGVAACTPINTSGDNISLNRPADELRTALVGSWYGKQSMTGGGTYEFVSHRYTNATYMLNIRITDPYGLRHTQTETGQWGASAKHFFTTFKAFVKNGANEPVNPMDTANYDIYKVVEFDGETLKYQHLSGGSVFTAIRVDEGFKLP